MQSSRTGALPMIIWYEHNGLKPFCGGNIRMIIGSKLIETA